MSKLLGTFITYLVESEGRCRSSLHRAVLDDLCIDLGRKVVNPKQEPHDPLLRPKGLAIVPPGSLSCEDELPMIGQRRCDRTQVARSQGLKYFLGSPAVDRESRDWQLSVS